VRGGVATDDRGREQHPGEEHVRLDERAVRGRVEPGPVHHPEPADVEARGDDRMGEEGAAPDAPAELEGFRGD
jgi:hypothetical protein